MVVSALKCLIQTKTEYLAKDAASLRVRFLLQAEQGWGGRGAGCSGLAQPRSWHQRTTVTHHLPSVLGAQGHPHGHCRCTQRTGASRIQPTTQQAQSYETTQVSIDFQSDSNYTLQNTNKCLGIRITADTNLAEIF